MNVSYMEHLQNIKRVMGTMMRELQGPMGAFGKMHQSVMAEGALSPKVKELIALGVSINAKCEGCIAQHVYDAMKAGATREEIVETIGITMLMGGAPGFIHGTKALDALEEFSKQG